MYKNIKVGNYGALGIEHIGNLGHIVIVCGKNNSGKTTLLKSVMDGKQYLPPDQLDTKMFYHCIRKNNGLAERDCAAYFDEAAASQEYWFEDSAPLFSQTAKTYFQQVQYMSLDRPRFYEEEVIDKFGKQLRSHRKVYIPPKRKLELSDTFETNKKVSSDGAGLLNLLFHANNQFEGSGLKKIFTKIRSLFQLVSGGYDFIITTGSANTLNLSFKFTGGEWIDAENCGLGLQDLLVMLYFVVSTDYDILVIEEPESHMHPEMQRKLLNVCKETKNKQFFFSTHSSVFLDLTLVDTILHTEMADGKILISNDTSRAALLDSLGYSVTDNLVSDLIILVEGPSDKPVLEELMRQMGFYSSYSVKIWPLGGDIMAQLDLSIFAEKYKIKALIDRDPGSQDIRNKFLRKCEELSIPSHQLERRAIENYFTVDALKKVFRGQFPNEITSIDPNIKLENQIGIDVKRNNKKIAEAMSIEDIQGTDLHRFLHSVEATLRESI